MDDLLRVVEVILLAGLFIIVSTIVGDYIKEWKKYKKDFE